MPVIVAANSELLRGCCIDKAGDQNQSMIHHGEERRNKSEKVHLSRVERLKSSERKRRRQMLQPIGASRRGHIDCKLKTF